MNKKFLYYLLFGPLFLFPLFSSSPANAYPGGVSGFSGKNGSTCTQCHSTGASPTVLINGPASVASGATASYTLTVSGGGNGGLDVATSGGTFTAGSGTQVMNGEITHTSATSAHSWTFSWTAPMVTTSTAETLYGAAIDGYSGGTGTTTFAATVTPATSNPSLTVQPSSLSFSYTVGGLNPAAQSVSIGSSTSSALTYTTAAAGGSWLSAGAGASTPGSVGVSVTPANMTAGTYHGTVTITASGAANSPQAIPVTLTINSAASPAIVAMPSSLNFAYTTGGTTPAAQSIAVSSGTSNPLSYTVGSTGGTWLSATGGGSSPGSVKVSVAPTGLSAGTYNGSVTITASGASNSPMSVPVVLTVSSTAGGGSGGGSLAVRPSQLVFYSDATDPAPHSITVNSTGSALSFTAEAFGGSWMSVTPSGGTTPGKVKVSVFASGLPAGTYSGVVQIKAGNSTTSVEVVLVVGGSSTGGSSGSGYDGGSDSMLRPFSFDPGATETVSAILQPATSTSSGSGSPAKSLALSKLSTSPSTAFSGALVSGAEGATLTQLGYDLKAGSECTAQAPQFVVITNDNVVHRAGCTQGRARATNLPGWSRVSFNPADPSQFQPPVVAGTTAKTVALVMAQVKQSGTAVLANLKLNGAEIGGQ